MQITEPLAPEGFRRIPWKNGRGALVVIDGEGANSWQAGGVAWHFGRTRIEEEGPFSDYNGYERLQVVVQGAGLVLCAPDHEIELRQAMRPVRYDGGLAIRTRLEAGPVEVVNLIADKARFDIELRVCEAQGRLACKAGRHVVYAPLGAARITIGVAEHHLAGNHALRLRADAETALAVQEGCVLVGSIHAKR